MPNRLYFKRVSTHPLAPAFDAAWNQTTDATRRYLLGAADGTDTIGTGTRITPWTLGQNALDRQCMFGPLNAQTISGTVKMQMRCRQYAATDNTTSRLGIRVVSSDGGTVRGTCLAVAQYGPNTFMVDSATHRNKTFADGDTLTSVDAQLGDYLVVEYGYSDVAGTGPEGQSAPGSSSGSDLAEDESTTTANNGWIEFSSNISYAEIVTPTTAALTLTAFAPTVLTPVTVTPTTAALVLTTFAPTVTGSSSLIGSSLLAPSSGLSYILGLGI